MAKLKPEERTVLFNTLVENGAIEEADLESMKSLSDAALVQFAQSVTTVNADEDKEDEEDEALDDEDTEDDEDRNDEDEPTGNVRKAPTNNACVCEKCGGMKGKKGKKGGKNEEEEEEETMNAEQWLASAPPAIQSVVRNAMNAEQQDKYRLIETLTANCQDKAHRRRVTAKLATNSLDDLKDLVNLIPTNARCVIKANFTGAGVPTGNARPNASRPLIPPTINWAEVAKAQDN